MLQRFATNLTLAQICNETRWRRSRKVEKLFIKIFLFLLYFTVVDDNDLVRDYKFLYSLDY